MSKAEDIFSINSAKLPAMPEKQDEGSSHLIKRIDALTESLERRHVERAVALARLAAAGKLDKALTSHFAELGFRFADLVTPPRRPVTPPVANPIPPKHTTLPTAKSEVALTMSSREIAGAMGKRHRDVVRDIRVMLEALQLNVRNFAHIYKDIRNREQTEFCLPKNLTITLVAGYKTDLRLRIIDRWIELEEAQRPVVDPEAWAKRSGEALKLLRRAKKEAQTRINKGFHEAALLLTEK